MVDEGKVMRIKLKRAKAGSKDTHTKKVNWKNKEGHSKESRMVVPHKIVFGVWD